MFLFTIPHEVVCKHLDYFLGKANLRSKSLLFRNISIMICRSGKWRIHFSVKLHGEPSLTARLNKIKEADVTCVETANEMKKCFRLSVSDRILEISRHFPWNGLCKAIFPVISIVQQKLWEVEKIWVVDLSNDMPTNFCQHVLLMAHYLMLIQGLLFKVTKESYMHWLIFGKVRNWFLWYFLLQHL